MRYRVNNLVTQPPATPAPTTKQPSSHICDENSPCEEVCRKLPEYFEKAYQCQCGLGKKPTKDGKCIKGRKELTETFCETDDECSALFPNSECGAKSCECKMNTEISKDKTECIPESDLLEKIKMFETYRIEEIWSNEGDRSNQRQGSDFRKRPAICKNEL